MSEMRNAILLVLIIEVCLSLLTGSGQTSPVVQFVNNFVNIDNNPFWVFLLSKINLVGISMALIGTTFLRFDWIWRATLATSFVTFALSLVNLWSFLNSHIVSSAMPANIKTAIITLIMAPLAIYYLFAVTDFITGKD